MTKFVFNAGTVPYEGTLNTGKLLEIVEHTHLDLLYPENGKFGTSQNPYNLDTVISWSNSEIPTVGEGAEISMHIEGYETTFDKMVFSKASFACVDNRTAGEKWSAERWAETFKFSLLPLNRPVNGVVEYIMINPRQEFDFCRVKENLKNPIECYYAFKFMVQFQFSGKERFFYGLVDPLVKVTTNTP